MHSPTPEGCQSRPCLRRDGIEKPRLFGLAVAPRFELTEEIGWVVHVFAFITSS